MFCPDPDDPSQLVEITAPDDDRPVSLNYLVDPTFLSSIEAFKRLDSNNKVVLTDLLRVANVSDSNSSRRGAVRFTQRLLPSQSQWQAYQSGAVGWNDLNWAQDVHGANAGLRQAWLSFELQLTQSLNEQAAPVVPCFGSATLYYELKK